MSVTIIAEGGCEHNGNQGGVVNLIQYAKDLGSDAIKFQLFTQKARPFAEKYILDKGDWEFALAVTKDEMGDFPIFWSVFDFESVDLARELGAKWVKLSFVERRNLELIERCEKAGFDRMFCSVDLYGQYCKQLDNGKWELLYCPNTGWKAEYPTTGDIIQWRQYAKLAKETGLGWSCHCQDVSQAIVAASLGAKVIEKHFKVDDYGPDANVAAGPEAFVFMVKMIREIAQRTCIVVDTKNISEQEIDKNREFLKKRGRCGVSSSITAQTDSPGFPFKFALPVDCPDLHEF